MIILKNITLRNFLSIGQVTQAVNFDRQELTLILGENLDLGGDGARNGTGKTSLIQALSYALFGVPINSIRKDYKIERGRKPNILRFYVNSDLQKGNDDAQGENKETQVAIEKVIHMSADMFRHIVALNTYSEPFLALKNNEQRDIIEQLLGITLLSEKAESIKQQLKNTKDDIQQEEFNVKAIEEANKRVKEQIESTKRRQKLWKMKHDEDLERLAIDYQRLITINIDSELQSHKDLSVWIEKKKQQDAYNSLLARSTAWQQKHDSDISVARVSYSLKNEYDIETELATWVKLNEWLRESITQDNLASTIATQTKSIEKEKKLISKLEKEVGSLEDHTCYACGQDFHDESHAKVLTDKQEMLTNARVQVAELANLLVANALLVKELGPQPTTLYKTEAEAIRHSSDLRNLKKVFEDKKLEANPFADQLSEYTVIELGRQPETHYDTESQAIEHRSKVANIIKDIERKSEDVDPYNEQIAEMENQALQEINFDKINRLTRTMEHQKFLLDILTSKDSFVRKKIIDQNLSYLNSRLTHYLDKIGLPHQVIFKNDLQVEITELGRELDFDNLSRGERNRLILGLSFAFRDVWENLYSPINTLFIDELIDSGLDTMGVENAIAILKDMSRRRKKSIWLVSHREELAGRVPNVLKVIKEAGFTSYSSTTDIS